MVAAADAVIRDHTHVQGHLAVCTAVLERAGVPAAVAIVWDSSAPRTTGRSRDAAAASATDNTTAGP